MKGSPMKKAKRVFAAVGIAVLVFLYLLTLYYALTDDPNTMHMFAGAVIMTICLPVFLYVYQMIYRTYKKKKNPDDTSDKSHHPDPSR